jgi:uncharacterized protein YraI
MYEPTADGTCSPGEMPISGWCRINFSGTRITVQRIDKEMHGSVALQPRNYIEGGPKDVSFRAANFSMVDQ